MTVDFSTKSIAHLAMAHINFNFETISLKIHLSNLIGCLVSELSHNESSKRIFALKCLKCYLGLFRVVHHIDSSEFLQPLEERVRELMTDDHPKVRK